MVEKKVELVSLRSAVTKPSCFINLSLSFLSSSNSHLSIIDEHNLPYRVDVETLDRMIMLEGDKSKYIHLYYFYANVVHKKIIELGYYYHKSNTKYILRRHTESPIMHDGEEEIRRSFDLVFRFLERLGYVHKNLRLTSEELGFFKAFVTKLDIDGVDDYIEYYKFNLDVLHP